MTSVSAGRLLSAAIALGLLLHTAGVLAQSEAELSLARRWYAEGVQHEKSGEWAAALHKFERALGVKDTAQLSLHVGLCRERLGRLAGALSAYERALEKARIDGLADVEKATRKRLVALRPRVPRLVVDLAQSYPELEIRLDGRTVSRAVVGDELPVDPGDHTLRTRARGYLPTTVAVHVDEGDLEHVAVELVADPAADGPGPPRPDTNGAGMSIVPGIVLLASGVSALGAGIGVLAAANDKDEHVDEWCGGPERTQCPASAQEEIEAEIETIDDMRVTSYVLGGVGIAASLVGIGLIVVWAVEDDEPVTTAWIAPRFGDGQGGVLVGVRF